MEYVITEAEYLTLTAKRKPYVQVNRDWSMSYYAVCPICDNPIQIVCLHSDPLHGKRKPHGRHCRKSVPGLAEFDMDAFLSCPYANYGKTRTGKRHRSEDQKQSKELLIFLREQFDRVIYIIQQESQIYITQATAEKMLLQFINSKAWTYSDTRMNNLPWAMANSDISHELYGRLVKVNTDLHRFLASRCPEVRLEKAERSGYVRIGKQPGRFVDLHYHFQQHEFGLSEDSEHMNETIRFVITRGAVNRQRTVYSKVLTIHTNRFIKLCEVPPEKARRDMRLLTFAQSIISPDGQIRNHNATRSLPRTGF